MSRFLVANKIDCFNYDTLFFISLNVLFYLKTDRDRVVDDGVDVVQRLRPVVDAFRDERLRLSGNVALAKQIK